MDESSRNVMANERSFLGTGWGFPPTFERASASVVMAHDEMDIRESLWILFSTQPGERVMVPDYGSQIWRMVFQSLTTTLSSRLKEAMRVAVLNWEPRIDIDKIEVQRDADAEGRVEVTLSYTIRKTNSRSNMVFPFYLQEGTLVAAPAP